VAFSVFLVAPWGDGAHCPCAACHAANDEIFRWLFQMRLGCSRGGAARSQISNGTPLVDSGTIVRLITTTFTASAPQERYHWRTFKRLYGVVRFGSANTTAG